MKVTPLLSWMWLRGHPTFPVGSRAATTSLLLEEVAQPPPLFSWKPLSSPPTTPSLQLEMATRPPLSSIGGGHAANPHFYWGWLTDTPLFSWGLPHIVQRGWRYFWQRNGSCAHDWRMWLFPSKIAVKLDTRATRSLLVVSRSDLQ